MLLQQAAESWMGWPHKSGRGRSQAGGCSEPPVYSRKRLTPTTSMTFDYVLSMKKILYLNSYYNILHYTKRYKCISDASHSARGMKKNFNHFSHAYIWFLFIALFYKL